MIEVRVPKFKEEKICCGPSSKSMASRSHVVIYASSPVPCLSHVIYPIDNRTAGGIKTENAAVETGEDEESKKPCTTTMVRLERWKLDLSLLIENRLKACVRP